MSCKANMSGILAAISSSLLIAGCGFTTTDIHPAPDSPSSDVSTTGLSLTVDIIGDTDVAGFRFILETCAGIPVATNDIELADLTLPGGMPNFVDAPFSQGSQHLFADHFMVLDPGCYNVVAQPITATGAASADCEPASATNLIVKPTKTTEVLLISQCPGPQVGALDVIAALDHKPRLENLVYEKFLCVGESVTICASASDPNLDPLSFNWTQLTGPRGLLQTLEVDSSGLDPATGIWTECVTVTPPSVGTYSMQVRASTPELAEDYDRAVLAFPIHVADCDPIGGGPEEPKEPKKPRYPKKDEPAVCPPPQPFEGVCAQVVVWARDPDTGLCCQYPTPCNAPDGWDIYYSPQECAAAVDVQ